MYSVKSHREFAVHNFKYYNEAAYIFYIWLDRILFKVLKYIKIFKIQYRNGFTATNFDCTQNGPPWKRYSREIAGEKWSSPPVESTIRHLYNKFCQFGTVLGIPRSGPSNSFLIKF